MKSPELTEFFSLLGKAKKEKKEEFDNLLKEADINLDVLTSSVVTGIKEAKVNIKKQKKKEEKLIEQLDSIIDVIENPKEIKDITEPAVTVGVPEDFDVSSLEDADDNPSFEVVDLIKPEPIKTPKISDTVAQAIKFIEETNLKEEIENSDETSLDNLKSEIKQVRDILYKVLAHGPGSGEVNLLKLDDVDEDSAKVDGKFLKYESSSGKFIGGDASGGAGIGTNGSVNTVGIITAAQFSGFSHLIAPHASTKTITVTVVTKTTAHRYYGTGSSQGYALDNVESPFLTLTPGRTYRFSGSVAGSHPFRFYLDAAKATAYTTGVTVGSGYVDLEVTDSTPTVLHYQCSSHGYMGNAVQVSSSNAIQLNSQSASYYLNYNNFTNTPTIPSNNNQLTNGAGYITTSFTNTNQLTNGAGFITASDDITGNAATATNSTQLNGQAASFYLNYNNFSNTPTIPTNNNQLTNGSNFITASDNITGTSAGLTGTPSITVTNITANGNVSIAGTLTYEDVTNIDSVGLVTARSGLVVGTGVTLSKDGDGFFTGVTTATTFVGSLTGTASNATQLNSQAASYYLDYNNFSNTPTIPTNNNQLTNGAGFITGSALNASNLSSGTIPDARFPSTLPAIDGSALTGMASTDNVRTGILDVAGIATFRDRAQFNSSVGIGIDDPLQKLHIADSTSANIYIETKNSTTGSTAGIYYKTSSSTPAGFFKTGIVLEDDGTSFARGKLHILQNNTADTSNATLSDSVVTFNQDGSVIVGSGITLSSDGDIFATGVTTSTTFVGDLTGDVTGTASNATLAVSAQGLTGSPNVTVTNVNAVDAIISGNLSVAGTITSLDQNDILATGIITASSGVDLGDPGIVTLSSDTLTTTSTSADTVASVSATVNRSATFQVQVTRGTQYHMTTINVIHDGTNAFLSEYGTIRTGEILATFDADISGGNLRLRVTPTSTASTVFKLSKTTIKV
jgi:hypothetical protein